MTKNPNLLEELEIAKRAMCDIGSPLAEADQAYPGDPQTAKAWATGWRIGTANNALMWAGVAAQKLLKENDALRQEVEEMRSLLRGIATSVSVGRSPTWREVRDMQQAAQDGSSYMGAVGCAAAEGIGTFLDWAGTDPQEVEWEEQAQARQLA